VVVALAHMAMTDWLLPNRQDRPEVINQARTEPYVEMAANYIKTLVPEDLKARASAILDEGSKAVEQGKELNDTLQKLSPKPGESPGDSDQNEGGGSQDGTQGSPAGNQGGQGDQSGYKDAERKDLERLIQGQAQ
jgi:membrane protein required for colicin V production